MYISSLRKIVPISVICTFEPVKVFRFHRWPPARVVFHLPSPRPQFLAWLPICERNKLTKQFQLERIDMGTITEGTTYRKMQERMNGVESMNWLMEGKRRTGKKWTGGTEEVKRNK